MNDKTRKTDPDPLGCIAALLVVLLVIMGGCYLVGHLVWWAVR